jgi:hypothetical protein
MMKMNYLLIIPWALLVMKKCKENKKRKRNMRENRWRMIFKGSRMRREECS